MTEAKLQLIADNRPRHEEFIIDHIEQFKEGFEKQDCFTEYVYWCKNRKGINNPGQEKTFRKNLSEYIVWGHRKDSRSGNQVKVLPRKRICGQIKEFYQITNEKYEELKQFALESYDEFDSDDEKPVLMRVDDE